MKKGIKAVSLTLLLVLFGVLTFFTKPKAKADGDVLPISSIEDWSDFCDQVNRGEFNPSEKTVQLMNDITCNINLQTLGTESNPFTGTFDGNGHKIQGRFQDIKPSMIGLFAFTENATIKNLNVSISYDFSDLEEGDYEWYAIIDGNNYDSIGVLGGSATGTTFLNCNVVDSTVLVVDGDGASTIKNISAMVAKADGCTFKDCKVKNSTITIDMGTSPVGTYSLNIGSMVALSKDTTFERCAVEYNSDNGDFINLNIKDITNFDINIGGVIGLAQGENALYSTDLTFSAYSPSVILDNDNHQALSTSTYNIGGLFGKAEIQNSGSYKGNLVTSSIVSDFIIEYDDDFASGANVNLGGVIGLNPANNESVPVITVINSSIETSYFPSATENRGILAGVDDGNGIYHDVFANSTFPTPNFGGDTTPRKIKEIDILSDSYSLDSGAKVNGSATVVDVLNYNSLQTYGPTGSSYENDPTKVTANFTVGGEYIFRGETNYTLADLCRTIEYYYSESNHPQITWIKGSNAQIDYDTSIVLPHMQQSEGNVWYINNLCTNPADLSQVVPASDVLVVFAKYEPVENTISFNLNGKTAKNASEYTTSSKIAYNSESLKDSIVLPVATGYTFNGYYVYSGGTPTDQLIDASGNLIKTNATYFSDNKWIYGEDLELKASWTAKEFTINYDIDGGDGVAPTSQSVTYSDNITATVKTYTGHKEGYTRNGWRYTIGSTNGTIAENNSVKPILDGLDNEGETSVTLYANWVQVHNITITNGNAYGSTLTDAPVITEEVAGNRVYIKGNSEECKAVISWTDKTPADLIVEEVDGKPGYWSFVMPSVDVELTPVYGPAHTLVKTNKEDATCETFGHLEYWKCSVCNKYFDNVDGAPEHEIADIDAWLAENGDGYLAPLGHDLSFDRIVWTDALAQAIYACSRDSHEEGYDCTVTHETLIPSTCTSVGTTRYTATYESHSDTKDIEDIPMVPHNYEWVVDQAATYYASGIKHEECTMCHDKRNENTEIPILTCTHEECTKHDGLEPTCLVAGHKEYYQCNTCSMLLDKVENNYVEIPDLDLWKSESGNGYLAPLGHEWGTPTYEWDQDECTAMRVCTRDNSHIETEVVYGTYVKDIDANCENNEKGHYTVVFTNPAFTDQVSEQVELENTALGHDYHVIYAWNEDKTKCTAFNECSRCNSKVLLEEVDAEYVKVSDATCTENEVGKMVATFTVQGLENQSTPNFEKENTNGHIFGEATYVWTNGECTATRVCTRDSSHTETETAQGVYSVVTPATCLANETGKYTVTFTNPAFTDQESQIIEKVDSALGHDYVFTSIEWTSFTAKAIYTCSRDSAHIVKYDCTVTSEVTKAATCQEKGIKTYTATYENHTSTKTEELNLVPHTLTHIEKLDATHDQEGHIEYYKCSVCNKLFEDSNASHEITLQQTIIPKLVRVTVEGAVIKNATGNILDLKPGDQVEIEANEPTEGQEFKGWALSEGGTIISSDKALKITIGSDIKYYAVYGPIEKKGLSTGALIGIIAGASALAIGAVVLLIVLKKKKQPKAN